MLYVLKKKQVVDTRGRLLVALGYGLWPSMVLISEIVQTFILADFCYYYVKRYRLVFHFHSIRTHLLPCIAQKIHDFILCSVFGGQLVLRLPSGVV